MVFYQQPPKGNLFWVPGWHQTHPLIAEFRKTAPQKTGGPVFPPLGVKRSGCWGNDLPRPRLFYQLWALVAPPLGFPNRGSVQEIRILFIKKLGGAVLSPFPQGGLVFFFFLNKPKQGKTVLSVLRPDFFFLRGTKKERAVLPNTPGPSIFCSCSLGEKGSFIFPPGASFFQSDGQKSNCCFAPPLAPTVQFRIFREKPLFLGILSQLFALGGSPPPLDPLKRTVLCSVLGFTLFPLEFFS